MTKEKSEVQIVLENHIERVEEELEELKFTLDEKIEYYESILRVANIRRNKALREKVLLQQALLKKTK
jgi:hypothetical protein